MKYDLEIVVPVSSKYTSRLEDFKKYGIFNVKNHSVLLTLICSRENVMDLDLGWKEGIDVRICNYGKTDYVSNTYRNFLEKKPESKWIMKIDDDSCTDVGNLLCNLEKFYDCDEKVYLASSLTEMGPVGSDEIHGPENVHLSLYKKEKTLGEIYSLTKHEIECCVISHAGMQHILNNQDACEFLRGRCLLVAGVTDVALAFAASISKLWPIDLPFSSHLPLVQNFSIFGGHLNHIHMVSRNPEGDNFSQWERCGEIQYEALTRAIDGTMSEVEKYLAGKRFIMETDEELRLYEFRPNRTLKIKFDDNNYVWLEYKDSIAIFSDPAELAMSLKIDPSGNLVGKDTRGRDLVLKPLNF